MTQPVAGPATGPADERERVQRRTLVVVVVAQVMGGAGLAAGVAVGALLAEQMLGSAGLAGIPMALFTLGSALAEYLVGRVSQRAGRRVGLGLGFAAGGSLAEHLHQHIVPRWTGDANFMPVIAHTKPLIQTLGANRDDIAAAWPRH